MENKNYITIENLDVYQLARQLSRLSWCAYNDLNWQNKKIIGDQFIRSADSVGANIVEGYSRFHYLDKINYRAPKASRYSCGKVCSTSAPLNASLRAGIHPRG